jgi:hypothetical protein
MMSPLLIVLRSVWSVFSLPFASLIVLKSVFSLCHLSLTPLIHCNRIFYYILLATSPTKDPTKTIIDIYCQSWLFRCYCDSHQGRDRRIRPHIDGCGSMLGAIYTLLMQKGQVSYSYSKSLTSRIFLLERWSVLPTVGRLTFPVISKLKAKTTLTNPKWSPKRIVLLPIPTRTLMLSSITASVYRPIVPEILVAPGMEQLMLRLINAINTQSRIIQEQIVRIQAVEESRLSSRRSISSNRELDSRTPLQRREYTPSRSRSPRLEDRRRVQFPRRRNQTPRD